jgi:hypothetical protein
VAQQQVPPAIHPPYHTPGHWQFWVPSATALAPAVLKIEAGTTAFRRPPRHRRFRRFRWLQTFGDDMHKARECCTGRGGGSERCCMGH